LSIKKLFYSFIACIGSGTIGALFTAQSIDNWFKFLNKPFFSPPNWVFGPVWTILYIMMGISLYIVWTTNRHVSKLTYAFFGTQLALNTVWSAVFFGLRSISGGLMIIIGLWLAIAATIRKFHQVSKLASWLLAPYLVWVSFAIVLNYSLYRLNK